MKIPASFLQSGLPQGNFADWQLGSCCVWVVVLNRSCFFGGLQSESLPKNINKRRVKARELDKFPGTSRYVKKIYALSFPLSSKFIGNIFKLNKGISSMIFSNIWKYLQVFRFLVTWKSPEASRQCHRQRQGAPSTGIVGRSCCFPKISPFSTKVNCLRCAAPEALEGNFWGKIAVLDCEIILSYCFLYFYSTLIWRMIDVFCFFCSTLVLWPRFWGLLQPLSVENGHL